MTARNIPDILQIRTLILLERISTGDTFSIMGFEKYCGGWMGKRIDSNIEGEIYWPANIYRQLTLVNGADNQS